MEKSSTAGWFESVRGDYGFIKEYETLINSVTENDIIHVANKYFKDSNYVLSVVKNK
jgi:predicted Zn-dependent peptidase